MKHKPCTIIYEKKAVLDGCKVFEYTDIKEIKYPKPFMVKDERESKKNKVAYKGAFFMMEYSNTGVTEFAIGLPTEEERKKLKDEGYTHMSNGITVEEHPQPYEIWMR